MCGRINLTTPNLREVAEAAAATLDPVIAADYHPRYNIAPTDEHWQLALVHGRRQLVRARWGVERRVATSPGQDPGPGPLQSKLLINARSEGVTGRAWGDDFRARRCAIPSTGFYEWSGPSGARRPLWFRPAGASQQGLLWLAGLYDEPGPDGEPRFVILTCPPNTLAATVHDRMPCVLLGDQIEAWLAAPDRDVLRPAPEGALEVVPVSRRLNDVKNDDPGCLVSEAAPEAAPQGQGPEASPAPPPAAPTRTTRATQQMGFAWAEPSAPAPGPSRRRR
ncbi:MAG TPA: SOS response-associated peptidase [Polyangia bacterium]|jgi:putative SOS response-associated peptidase YedK|nr:SOS response-associated peptidase [Polyangia bacterium]